MAQTDFNRVGKTDSQLFGESCLLVAGFSHAEQESLQTALMSSELAHIPLVYITTSDIDEILEYIIAGKESRKVFADSVDDKALILSGFKESQLQLLMKKYRGWRLPKVLWATLTEANQEWVLGELLDELVSEAMKMK